ncbi:MAG TPA: porin family protein [Gemmatimonadaceae bacterium]|nr:porin family protein [Gemmatimonadaceae bacterium]
MHKRFVIVSAAALAFAAASHTATAQIATPKPTIGVLGGLNFSTLSGSDFSGVSNRTGFQAGLFLTLHMNQAWSIEPEALYTQEGATASGETAKMNYLQVPVLLRWDVMAKSPMHPFFMAGPAAAFQVGCDLSASGQTASCDDLSQSGQSPQKKTFDVLGVAGAGLGFNVGATQMSVGARYSYGFSDAFQNSDIKNRYFSVLLGLTF